MRISDWSSDVCSSDLSAAYPHYALVMAPMGCLIVGYAVRGNIPGYAMLAYILNLSLDNIGLYERRLQANALLAPQYSEMAKAIAPHVDRKRCLYVYHGPVILYTLTQRSEEHTSELQSLIRISYAV